MSASKWPTAPIRGPISSKRRHRASLDGPYARRHATPRPEAQEDAAGASGEATPKDSNTPQETLTIEASEPPNPERTMNNVTEIVTLRRQQAELEFRNLAGRADAVAAEREWESTRRRLIAHPESLRAVLETAGALLRTPDAIPVRDVTAFGGSH
jgi:hypothetical protein